MNLQRRTDDRDAANRGVSEVVGAILIFGLVLAVLALVQVSAVPAANQQVEFEHSQRIEGDFQRLDEAIEGAATRGLRETTPLELGTRYPPRIFLLNPPPVSGDLSTSPAQLQLSGFNATNPETDDYLRESLPSFDTRAISYRADYNEYRSAPRIGYENGILYERYGRDAGGRDVLVDGGALVSGRRITIITLDGSLSTQQVDELSLDAIPVSASSGPVSVEAQSGASITVETSLSEETWRTKVLASELDENEEQPNVPDTQPDRYVTGIDCPGQSDPTEPCNGELVITFEPGTYDLRMAKVGLGSGFDEEGAEYLTTIAGDETSVISGQTQRLTVEVRDRFNNPVSGVPVTFSPAAGSGTILSNQPVISGEDGRATVTFTPSDGTGTKQVTATIAGGGAERQVTFEVTVTDPDGDGGTANPGGPINPYDRNGGLSLTDVDRGASNRYDLTFTNNADQSLTLTSAQLNFYYFQRPGQPSAPIPRSARLGSTDGNILLIRGPPEDVADITFAQGQSRTIPVYFYSDAAATTPYNQVNNDDFFVLSGAVSGRENLYFVSQGPTPVEPIAEFTYSPASPTNTTEVTFDASASNDPDGTVDEYRWDFDNDGVVDETTTTPTVTHTYTTPGSYTAALRVVDNDGLVSPPERQAVTVSANTPPKAAFSFTPTNPNTGQAVSFDASASSDADGSIIEYRWNFGDGTTTTTPNPTTSHTYATGGTRTVSLTVIDDEGGSRTETQQITVAGGGGGGT